MKNLPEFMSDKFACPHCQVNSQQTWFESESVSRTACSILDHIYYEFRTSVEVYQQKAISFFLDTVTHEFSRILKDYMPASFAIALCATCGDISVWIAQEMVYPRHISLPEPNGDIDDEIKEIYTEAASIFIDSPRGSTALLRLALQKLLKQVGKKGENINSDIKELVSEGLSPKIRQALDLLRVIGNNAVHPGQINLDDNKEIALKLFHILNFIADELISKPKELERLYNGVIPKETQEHIKQRDKK